MKQYEFFPSLTKASIVDYEELFLRVYGNNAKLNQQYLQWLYVDNPHGKVIGIDAFCEGELAAHYAAIPRLYSLGGERYRALLSVNTATCPNHQRQGLFKRTAGATYDLAIEQGYAGIIGVANQQSIHAFISSLGFTKLGNVDLLITSGVAPHDNEDVSLKIVSSSEWLTWRLSQPGAEYAIRNTRGSAKSVVSRRRGFLNFELWTGRLGEVDQLPHQSKYRWPVPSLRPCYPKPRGALALPRAIMPSPWHVIARPLSNAGFLSLCEYLQLTGLEMDTF